MLDVVHDHLFMATVYWTALIIGLKDSFGRLQIFGDQLTLSKCCQNERPSGRGRQAVLEMVRSRALN